MLKVGQEVLIHGYIDEIRKDTIIIQNEGGYFGTVECEIADIDMPNTNDVLDKIRAEIENIDLLAEYTRGDIKRMALAIIDKYKAESEVEE
jgi:hypothetical protein